MVARILTGKSIRGLINYNESKVEMGKAAPILANRFGLEIEELKLRHKVARFEHLTKLNSRVKTNAVHIMLNFDASEGLSSEKLQRIAVDYMNRIGFGEQPYLVYRHRDANHPHIHIVTTNVKADSERIDMHNIGRDLSETARKEIELEYKLVKAEDQGKEQQIVSASIDRVLYGDAETKSSIYNVVTTVLRSYSFTSFAEYNAVLKCFNVTADRGGEESGMFQNRGLVYSILDDHGNRIGIPFKASSFAGKPTLNKVESKFARNLKERKRYVEPLKQRISEALDKNESLTQKDLVKALKKQGISLLFRQNSDGRIYGITYVDHNSRCVFNGSELGKIFSAKAVSEKLLHSDSDAAHLKAHILILGKRESDVSVPRALEAHKSSGDGLLKFLLEKPTEEPITTVSLHKKKKKKKGRSKNRAL